MRRYPPLLLCVICSVWMPAFGDESLRLPKIEIPPKAPPLAAAASLPAKTIVGKVTNESGEAVAQSQVWVTIQEISPLENLVVKDTFDGTQPFRLSFPESWLPTAKLDRNPIVWGYAPGYAIGSVNAYEQFADKSDKPVSIVLPNAEDRSFVVLLPGGKPAVGATVQPRNFLTPRNVVDYVPRELAELVGGSTDANGRISMPGVTGEGLFRVEVKLAGFGTQQFRCQLHPGDPTEQTLQLRPVGRVEGRILTDQSELVRDMFVSIETESRDENPLIHANGIAIVKVDDTGEFVIPQIAEGNTRVFTRCDERLPVRVRLPKVSPPVDAGETSRIDLGFELGVSLRGVVIAADTRKPLSTVTISVSYGAGQFARATTNEMGEYSTTVLPGDMFVQVISMPAGYQQMGSPWREKKHVSADPKGFSWPPIELVPAIKITGKLVDDEGKPLTNAKISGLVGNRRYGFGQSDENGAFTLNGVPKEVDLKKFEVLVSGVRLEGTIESSEPLVVRVKYLR